MLYTRWSILPLICMYVFIVMLTQCSAYSKLIVLTICAFVWREHDFRIVQCLTILGKKAIIPDVYRSISGLPN
jgi:hypothetical protein